MDKVFICSYMTIVTFQNGRKLTFNPIYFANEFCDLQSSFLAFKHFFCLSNKYADLKTNSVDPIFLKTKKTYFFFKNNYLQNFF